MTKIIHTLLAATALTVAVGFTSSQAAPAGATKNIVLVHGAFADGSGWKAVAELLRKRGYNVSIVQPPETSLDDDGTVPSFGVMRRWPLTGADHWRGRISVRNRNPGYHYRRRTELGAADRRHVATNASAAICSFAGSPGNWRFLP